MTNLDKRIEQLEELKDKTMVLSSEGVSKMSYIQLLVYHLSLLKEMRKLIKAFDDNDVESVTKWYENRRQ